MSDTRNKLLQLRKELGELILERGDEVGGLIIALLTRKHILLVGPAGTGKSLMIRLVASVIDGARYWERLFTKFTMPDEIFGPVSMVGYKQDVFRRLITGHLPEANFAFADEIFKGGSSIMNSLLTIMNERLFHNDGAPLEVPLEVLMGASNEIPSDESLMAFYDRFLLRFKVNYIAEPSHFLEMLKGPRKFKDFTSKLTVRLSLDEIHAAQEEVQKVRVTDPVLEGLASIRLALLGHGTQPSDRRFNEGLELVKAKAWLQGRDEVIMDDLSILTNVLWNDPNDRQKVQGIILEVANPLLKKAEELNDGIQRIWDELLKVQEEKEKTPKALEVLHKVNKAVKELQQIKAQGDAAHMDMIRVEEYIHFGKAKSSKVKSEWLGTD